MTIGVYGIGSQSGRAYFADYLSKGYDVIGYARNSANSPDCGYTLFRVFSPPKSPYGFLCRARIKSSTTRKTDAFPWKRVSENPLVF